MFYTKSMSVGDALFSIQKLCMWVMPCVLYKSYVCGDAMCSIQKQCLWVMPCVLYKSNVGG